METNEIMQYYDDLNRLAQSRCENPQDAEDLVAETMLAYVSFTGRGGVIAYPKTWLANTLMHKVNSFYRRRYRMPRIVNFDRLPEEMSAEETCEAELAGEYADIRRAVNYLAKMTREVLTLYYFGGRSVAEIAEALGIPEGTVKSRLFHGRKQVRKGLEEVNMEKTNVLPSRLHVSNNGESGPNGEPASLVEGDLIAQNLLILAYEEPLTITELSKAIGIPAAYIEPIVERLADGELMARAEKDRFYTDFIIYQLADPQPQLAFVKEHFASFWAAMSGVIARTSELDSYGALNVRQKRKIERYAVMRMLQDFSFRKYDRDAPIYRMDIPMRKDGGRWIAQGHAYPPESDRREDEKRGLYLLDGGHRSTWADGLTLYEFDTNLWDNPHRFGSGECMDCYFRYIHKALWCLHTGREFDTSVLPDSVIEKIPMLETVGLIAKENGRYTADIPIISRDEYNRLNGIVDSEMQKLAAQIGDAFGQLILRSRAALPKHLKSVPDFYRDVPATNYIVMAAVREAYDRGIYLQDVDYCCPPVVLVYEKDPLMPGSREESDTCRP